MTASALRPGDPAYLGRYRLLSLLGEGGMGSVYLAETPARRKVAIKVIRPRLATDAGFLARFRSEVKRARQVPPFCTAEVLDADVNHDPPYLVVEYIDGPSLAEIIQEHGPLSGSQLHSIAIGVTTALAAIHDAGIVHRDLKPANVLLAPLSTPKVIDFGIAKALDATNAHTEPGMFLGTIAYMGPERFQAGGSSRVGTASDIFAWGAVVTYAATGRTPYPHETLIATAGGVPLPIPDLTDLPRPLRDLVTRALAEDPARRPTAHELLDELIQAGAAGDRVISASLRTHPGLRRAASAVQHTAPVAAPGGNTPVRPRKAGLATLEQPPASWLRWLPPRIVSAIAVAALAAGFGAYPATSRLLESNREPVAAASFPALDQRVDSADKPSRADRRSRCTLDGPLEVEVAEPKAFTCPLATGTDQTIDAKIQISEAGVCAAIGTHVVARSSYRIAVCADRVTIECIYRGKVSSLGSARLEPVLEPGRRHRAEVITAGPFVTVIVNGKTVISRAPLEPQLDPGSVTLGAVAHPSPRKTGSATFSDFTVSTTT